MAAGAKIHRNVTLHRLTADFFQFIRSQRPVIRRLGRPFQRSRRFVEMDITYRCNLRCGNCNRSCTQAPSDAALTIQDVGDFLAQSREQGARWDRIRLLGGEPTLHKDFFAILDLLLSYRADGHPALRIVVCTNGAGRKVNRVLDRLPEGVVVKNTFKNSRQRFFRPFNKAPIDAPLLHRFSDFSVGCRIIEECGLGLTPLGYYPCAIAGGIDRIFGFNLGRQRLPSPDDDMRDLLSVFCPLCGHFGVSGFTKKAKTSVAWEAAYAKYAQPPGISDPFQAVGAFTGRSSSIYGFYRIYFHGRLQIKWNAQDFSAQNSLNSKGRKTP